ncbi:ubiquinol-cytochrome-c reductase complex assembly factor 2 [Platysternon megacephalum]|uniref:Ubiquinol-cytochrome-c reductase complex assembly factor 2 n=1 Tax=Platysternon megacephalum TaxID=55544 RepID=A0A4D9E246_9SAUR|nr:ubiquinol-cytochrome-c reductase complex assembly factor 2 [Platysternon megacephalum]
MYCPTWECYIRLSGALVTDQAPIALGAVQKDRPCTVLSVLPREVGGPFPPQADRNWPWELVSRTEASGVPRVRGQNRILLILHHTGQRAGTCCPDQNGARTSVQLPLAEESVAAASLPVRAEEAPAEGNPDG